MSYSPDLELHQDIPLKDKLIKKGFWLYFFAFLVAPAGYVIKMMISRELAVADIGVIYSVIGLITIISSYNDLGLTEALQYYLPHYLIDKEYVKAKMILVMTWIMQFATGLLIGGILFFLAPWLAQYYFQSSDAVVVLRIFCLYFLTINLFQVLQSVFIAAQEVKWYNGVDSIRLRSIAGFVGLMLWSDQLTMMSFARAWIGGLVIALICAIIFFWKKFGRLIRNYEFAYDKELFVTQRRYAIWVVLGLNVGTILGQIDQQFAIYFLGPEAAGYWTNYLSLMTASNIVTMPLITYLFPLYNELEKKGEQHKIGLLNRYLYGGVAVFGVIAGVVGWFWGERIAILLFGQSFAFSGVLFSYVAPFLWLNVLVAIGFQRLASLGLVKLRVKILAIALLINTVVSIAMIHQIGIEGLIIGTVVSRLVMVGWLYTVARG